MSLLRSEDFYHLQNRAQSPFHNLPGFPWHHLLHCPPLPPSLCLSTHCKLSYLAEKEDFIPVPSSAWNVVSFSICTLFFSLHNRTQLLSVFPLCVILCKTATLQLSFFCSLSYSSQHSLPPDCICRAIHTMWMPMTQMAYFLLYIVHVSCSHTSMCIHMTFILTLVHMWVLWVRVVFPVRTGTLAVVFMLTFFSFRVSIILRMRDVPCFLLCCINNTVYQYLLNE